jgi:glutamyl-tRNA synthetase
MVRTRFAPSPTGYLHIGGVRTALFSWAFARHHGGTFILRIEDTDLERSTEASVQAILEGMRWVGLDFDEGPFYQSQRTERYQAVIQEMLAGGQAYYCYASREELDALRETQMAAGAKPRYDHRWRPETGKVLPSPPEGVKPVVRFKNPLSGSVAWQDLVKGRIEIANEELDDLIIARADGSPTYNFCVVVDDWDMQISHVIRGDDHVNNTPRQINILQAIGANLPIYAHLPMILRDDGLKMSKRRDAVSVVEYEAMGYLPEALLNYLSRLGWGHGDDEIYDLPQFVEWFGLDAVSPSPSRFNKEKLDWVNQQHIKSKNDDALADLIRPMLAARQLPDPVQPPLDAVIGLVKERSSTLLDLASLAELFYQPMELADAMREQHLDETSRQRLMRLIEQMKSQSDWSAEALSALLKAFATAESVKMAAVAMPLRAALFGTTQTPAIDKMLALMGQDLVLKRLYTGLQAT